MSACAPSATSRHGGRFTLQGKTEILLCCIQAAVPRRVQRLFCVICGRGSPPESPTGCIQTDISICCILREELIYQPGGIRTFFALLIYQFGPGSYSTEGRGNGRRRERRGTDRAQKITGGTVNVTGIIEIFPVLPLLHPRFLCKSLKYTSCTVFQRKFIHFGKDVELHAKTRAIFVRFYPVSL